MTNKINPNDPLVGKAYRELDYLWVLQITDNANIADESFNPELLEAVWDVLGAVQQLQQATRYEDLSDNEIIDSIYRVEDRFKKLTNYHPEVKAWLEESNG